MFIFFTPRIGVNVLKCDFLYLTSPKPCVACNKIHFKARTIPYRISVTAFSIYSQISSISGGRLLHPQTENALCRGENGPT
jgi:hypothetical protein